MKPCLYSLVLIVLSGCGTATDQPPEQRATNNSRETLNNNRDEAKSPGDASKPTTPEEHLAREIETLLRGEVDFQNFFANAAPDAVPADKIRQLLDGFKLDRHSISITGNKVSFQITHTASGSCFLWEQGGQLRVDKFAPQNLEQDGQVLDQPLKTTSELIKRLQSDAQAAEAVTVAEFPLAGVLGLQQKVGSFQTLRATTKKHSSQVEHLTVEGDETLQVVLSLTPGNPPRLKHFESASGVSAETFLGLLQEKP